MGRYNRRGNQDERRNPLLVPVATCSKDYPRRQQERSSDAANGGHDAPSAPQKSSTAVTRPRLDKPARSLRILVAEDTDENRELVSELLKKRGHSVVAVSDGRQALDELAKNPYRHRADGRTDAAHGWPRSHPRDPSKREIYRQASVGRCAHRKRHGRGQTASASRPAWMDSFRSHSKCTRSLTQLNFLATAGTQVIAAKPSAAVTSDHGY